MKKKTSLFGVFLKLRIILFLAKQTWAIYINTYTKYKIYTYANICAENGI